MGARHVLGVSGIAAVLAQIALVGVVLVGCALAQPFQPEVTPTIPTSSAPSTTSAAPPPDSGGSGTVSVELAQLPIGGNVTVNQVTLADDCVTVNWIVEHDAAKIPANVQIEIRGAAFTENIYALADSGCSGENPPCIGFVFDAAHKVCDLAIAPTGAQPSSPDAQLTVSISGKVRCNAGESAACRSFLSAVAAERSLSIPLDAPPVQTPTATTHTTTTHTSTTTPAATDGVAEAVRGLGA